MFEQMKRRGFLRVMAAAPMVALALKSDGTRAARNPDGCPAVSLVCTANPDLPNLGPCSSQCKVTCDNAYLGACPACQNRVC